MRQAISLRHPPSRVAIVLVLWVALAIIVGATGLLALAPIPPPAIALALTVGTLLALRASPSLREEVRGLGFGPLVAFHLTRLVAGAYFLVLYGRGVLPAEFALPAGWGDIAVALLALPVLWLCLPVRTGAQRAGLLLWNTLGLIDILGVLANGVRLFTSDPSLAEPFARMPLALLPTFVVPLVIVTHVLLFVWLLRPGRDAR